MLTWVVPAKVQALEDVPRMLFRPTLAGKDNVWLDQGLLQNNHKFQAKVENMVSLTNSFLFDTDPNPNLDLMGLLLYIGVNNITI